MGDSVKSTQTVESKIWTWVDNSISYDSNCYTKYAFLLHVIPCLSFSIFCRFVFLPGFLR